jgi:hypothetical protein
MEHDTKHHPLASLSPNKPLSPTKMPAGQDAEKSKTFDNGADFHKQMLQSKLSGQKYVPSFSSLVGGVYDSHRMNLADSVVIEGRETTSRRPMAS